MRSSIETKNLLKSINAKLNRDKGPGELNILEMRRGTAATRPRVRMVGKVSNLGDWCGDGW